MQPARPKCSRTAVTVCVTDWRVSHIFSWCDAERFNKLPNVQLKLTNEVCLLVAKLPSSRRHHRCVGISEAGLYNAVYFRPQS